MTIPSRVRGLPRGETKRALMLFNWNAGLRAAFDTICPVTGFVFVGYALALGVPKEQMGVFAAITNGACVLQIVALLLLNQLADKKRFALTFAFIEPVVVMVGMLSLLLLPAAIRLPAMAISVALAATSYHLTRPTLDEWFASSLPASVRGRYLGRRLQVLSVVMIAATLGMGWLAERVPTGAGAGYAYILAGGAAVGLLAVIVLTKIPLPAVSAESRVCWADVSGILRTWPFLRFLAGMLLYNVPFFFACPYYQVFHLEVLYMPKSAIALMMVGYYLVKVIISPLCGRLNDRLGPRAAIYLISPLYLGFFLLYAVAQQPWVIFIAWALVSMADAQFMVSTSSALYGAVPDTPARPAYFALYNLASSLITAIGAIAAIAVVEWLKPHTLTLGAFTFDQFHLLYAACFVVLIPCLFATQLYPGKKAVRISQRHG